jgi:hypothetical protein
MALDLSSLDAAMKQYYNDQMYQELVYSGNPLLALLPKDEKFRSKNMPIPLKISNGGGISASFSVAQAQAAAGAPKFEDFLLTHVQMFSLAEVDGLIFELAQSSAGAFVDAATAASDSAYGRLANTVSTQLFRAAGELGQLAAEPSETAGTFTVTLKNKGDVVNVDVGQTIMAYAALSGGSPKTSDGSDDEWVVAGVDVSAGTITFTGTYNSSGNLAANDYIFLEGTRGASTVISGLAAWVPPSAPSATPFFGVDRTIDATKLGGVRHDGSAQSIEEALIEASYKVGKVGGKPEIAAMSFEDYGALVKSLGSKVQYVDLKVGEVGFRAVEIHGPRGTIKVLADRSCPQGTAWLLDVKSWKLCTAGKAIGPVEQDGRMWLRRPTADGVECRFAFRGNLACNAPGHNACVTLPAIP